jgi:hypothetical protein
MDPEVERVYRKWHKDAVRQHQEVDARYARYLKEQEESLPPGAKGVVADFAQLLIYFWKLDVHQKCTFLLMTVSRWGATTAFRRLCIDVAFHEDTQVRGVAMQCLASAIGPCADQWIGQVFASVVMDTTEPLAVRASAYIALFTLKGIPMFASYPLTERGDLFARWQFPEDVDWSFVSSFLPHAEADPAPEAQ